MAVHTVGYAVSKDLILAHLRMLQTTCVALDILHDILCQRMGCSHPCPQSPPSTVGKQQASTAQHDSLWHHTTEEYNNSGLWLFAMLVVATALFLSISSCSCCRKGYVLADICALTIRGARDPGHRASSER